jgi:hypothetical protein
MSLFTKQYDTDADIQLEALLKELRHTQNDFVQRSGKMIRDLHHDFALDKHHLYVTEHAVNKNMARAINDISHEADEIFGNQ